MLPKGVTIEALAEGRNKHLTFGSAFRRYLRVKMDSWPSPDEMLERPFLERIVVKSLLTCLEDTEIGAKERKLVMERVEGRPTERKEVGITMTDLTNSALATSIRDIQAAPPSDTTAGRPKTVMIEPGPDLNDPMAGAVLEHVAPQDEAWTEVLDAAGNET
jgi:hypothetical protein